MARCPFVCPGPVIDGQKDTPPMTTTAQALREKRVRLADAAIGQRCGVKLERVGMVVVHMLDDI